MKKIEKCPFCGTEPIVVHFKKPWCGEWYALKHPFTKIGCLIADDKQNIEDSRYIGRRAFKTEEDAIDFWNSSISTKMK